MTPRIMLALATLQYKYFGIVYEAAEIALLFNTVLFFAVLLFFFLTSGETALPSNCQ